MTFYKDLNDFKLKEGLMSKQQYDEFMNSPLDYVRQQRELPDWLLDKPKGKSGGAVASISKSNLTQKRNKYASAELLSPMETAIKTAQLAHVEAYRNKAAKTITSLLQEAGEGKLVRSTDVVREKQALLTAMKESKPIATSLDRVLRSNKKQVKRLETELRRLNIKGMEKQLKTASDTAPAFQAELLTRLKELPGKSKNTRELMQSLVSENPAGMKQIRNMIESRDAKLAPLMDKVELLSRDLHDLYAHRSGMWNQANSMKTTVDKSKMTSLSFLDDGVENIVKVDPVIAAAVHNWDKQSQNVMNNVLRATNNIFKMGTTGMNVGFALPNFVADQISSGINSKAFRSTHNPVNFMHTFMMTIGKPMNAEDDKILREFLKGNSQALSINQYTKRASAEQATNKLAREGARRGQKAYTLIRNPKDGLRALFDSTESLIGSTEKFTRVQNFRGTYKKAAKDGLDATKLANVAARENSVDFMEMGSYGRMINTIIPYFNAGIQGNRTLLRNFSERPATFAAKSAALIGVPVAATTIWNTTDKKRNEIYKTIPDYIKESNLVVISPGAKWNADKRKWDGVFIMKKPPGYKELAEPVRKYIEYAANDPKQAPSLRGFLQDQGGSLASDFGSAITPIDFSDPNKFLSSVTPQLLKPTAEAILNKDFFTGQDIVSGKMKDFPANEQKYEQYSQLTSHIASVFNTSPLKVDKWIKATFGEVGVNAQNMIDKASGAPKEAIGGRPMSESVSRRFVGAPGAQDQQEFYKTYNPAYAARVKASSEVTRLVKEGKVGEAKRRAQEYNDTLVDRFSPFYDKYRDSPTFDTEWSTKVGDLQIKVSDRSIDARRRQK